MPIASGQVREESYEKHRFGRGNFPARLRQLREERHLSQSDLAEKTGLTYRTIHDIELGKRARVQEKTLLLVARALGLTLEELLNGDGQVAPVSPPSGRSLWLRAGVLVALGFVGAAAVLWWTGLSHASWTHEDLSVAVKHGVFGVPLWSTPPDTPVSSCEEAPWDSGQLILGLSRKAPGGGAVRCLDRKSGEVVWEVKPDIDAMIASFGEEVVMAAGFSFRQFGFSDVDGDGEAEILVRLMHGLYYPSAAVIIDRHGNQRSHYAAKGHIMHLEAVDIDGDGKDEIVGGGTNNAKAYQGAMLFVLDEVHADGATIDAECNPWSTEPDSALVRVVLPQFPEPYMELMGATRLCAWNVQAFRHPDGEARLSCMVGGPDHEMRVLVHFDQHMDPVGAEPTDRFREIMRSQWPDSLVEGTGPDDPVWLAGWLAQHRKFEAGHWPQSAASNQE